MNMNYSHLSCPWCKDQIYKDRFIRSNYYCPCGWSYLGEKDSGSGMLYMFMFLFLFAGVYVLYSTPNLSKDQLPVSIKKVSAKVQHSQFYAFVKKKSDQWW